MNNHELNNRIAVVSGASSGIGRSIARQLVAAGVRVVINGRRSEPLERLEAELNNGSENVKAVSGDVANVEIVNLLLDTARTTFGAEADIVVVNAGRGLGGSVLTSDAEQWEELIRTNLLGALQLMRYSGQRLMAQLGEDVWPRKACDLIILGSNVGRHISPFSSVYGATKFAVNSLAEALRRELGPKGVRVTLIEPGIVKTGFQDAAGYDPRWFAEFAERIGPVLDPDDVARLVLFILSQPPHVHINDVLIRPTRQDYP